MPTDDLYTDDDVAAGAEALYEAAYSLTSLTVTECEGLVEAVLDAVLPDYRKRLRNELADGFESLPDADYHRDVVVLVLRRVAEETP